MSDSSPPRAFRFGLFDLDCRSGELRRDGLLVKRIQEQPLRVLMALVERPGELVTREELRARVWPDQDHGDFDHGLHAAINRLREMLGDSADEARYIQTVPRRGYRFVAPVTAMGSAPAERAVPVSATPVAPQAAVQEADVERPSDDRPIWIAAGAAAFVLLASVALWMLWRRDAAIQPGIHDVRVAVLPLENLTGDAGQDVFVDGLHEELIFRLGLMQPRRLAVVARTSVMGYRQTPKTIADVARELSVDYVLEGSVRRQGARFRITAQLIRGDDQSHVWTETYDRLWSDLLSLEADIAARVADSLAIELLPAFQARLARDRRISLPAYEAYLRGKFYWNQRNRDPANLVRAEAELQKAIGEQPDYADAHAALADTYDSMIFSGAADASPTLERARGALARALALDPEMAAAHSTAGYIAMHFDRDWVAAERSFQRALAIDPNNALTHLRYAQLLIVHHRFTEAEREMAAARTLDPLAADVVENEAWLAWYQRADTRALQLIARSADLDADIARARMFSAYVFAVMGDCDSALGALEQLGRAADAFPLESDATFAVGRCSRDRTLVETLRRELTANGSTFAKAMLELGLGEVDRFFEDLGRADAERRPQVIWMGVDPAFASIRNDTRFAAFMRQLGLQ